MHIVIINPKTCTVKFAKVFDTYKSSDDLDKFIDLENINFGFIVVAACKDDCARKLSENAKLFFSLMGS